MDENKTPAPVENVSDEDRLARLEAQLRRTGMINTILLCVVIVILAAALIFTAAEYASLKARVAPIMDKAEVLAAATDNIDLDALQQTMEKLNSIDFDKLNDIDFAALDSTIDALSGIDAEQLNALLSSLGPDDIAQMKDAIVNLNRILGSFSSIFGN